MSIENTDTFGNYLVHGIDEILIPEAISWWPSTPGWQVLGVIIVLLLIARATRWVKHRWRNRYRRQALRQLERLQQQAGGQLQDVVTVLPYYIKLTALQAYPRADVASLSGPDWLAFLDAHYSGPSFAGHMGKNLLSVSYLPREQWQLNDTDCHRLIEMSRRWIASHRQAAHV
jgi:Ca-activated chloride channel family protein